MIVGKIEIYKTRAKTLYIMDLPEGMKGGKIKLDFKDPVWDGLIKMYTFENHDDLRNRVLPVDGVEIPSEVLVANTHLRFGVYGVDANGRLAIPTIWADLGNTYPSTATLSDPDLDPDLPVWAQILSRIGNLEQLQTLCKTDLVCAINEIYDIAQSVREDADAGEFSGATFTPILERVKDGVKLSWVNDKGKPNPEPVILREKNEVSVQKKADPVPEEAEFIIYEDEEAVIPWIEADLTCASASEATVKTVTNSDGSPAEVEDHQVRLIRFADGNTADKVTLKVGEQSFTMARNPWRYSDLSASCPVGEIPVGHTCLVHFDGQYAFWQDCGFRPLVSLAEEQFGWDMMKLIQGERQETVLSEAQVALADEIEDKLSQAGGVYLYFSTYDTTVKLSDFASGSNYFRFNAVDQGREFVFDYDKTTRTVAAYMIGYAKEADLHQPCFATCTAGAAPSTTAPVTWYIPKTMPKPSGNPGMLVDVFWKFGRVDGLGYDISLVWGEEGGSDNEVIVPKTSVNDSLTGEHGIPAEGTIRYQLEEIDGRRHWRYVSGDLIYKSFSTDTAADVADKLVPGMSIAYLPTMEIYVQLDKGNTADLMRLVPDDGETLPVYGNGTGAKTGKVTPGTILHLKNAGDHWQILNSGGGAIAHINQVCAPALVKTVQGEVVAVDDVSPLEHDVGCTVMRANILPYPYLSTTKTEAGVTYTDNGDGTISVSGDATGYSDFYLQDFKIDKKWHIVTFYYAERLTNIQMGVQLLDTKGSVVTGFNIDNFTSDREKTIDLDMYPSAETISAYIKRANNGPANGTITPIFRVGKNALPYAPYIPDLSAVTVSMTDGIFNTVWAAISGKGKPIETYREDGYLAYSAEGIIVPQNAKKVTISGFTEESPATEFIFTDSANNMIDSYTTRNRTIDIPAGAVRIFTSAGPMSIKTMVVSFDTGEKYPLCKNHKPSSDGNVPGVRSISPDMTLLTDTPGALMEVTYNQDSMTVIRKLTERITALENKAEPLN